MSVVQQPSVCIVMETYETDNYGENKQKRVKVTRVFQLFFSFFRGMGWRDKNKWLAALFVLCQTMIKDVYIYKNIKK